MFCVLKGDKLAVRTSYNETYDLVQTFIGFLSNDIYLNPVVNFSVSSLIEKSEKDIFKEGIILAPGWDEPTPFKINEAYIGANHGQPAGVLVKTDGHGKSYEDIGSLWIDEANIKWTLIKVVDEKDLMFISENIGESMVKYVFVREITGDLTYVSHGENHEKITVEETISICQIYPSVRMKEKKVYAVKDGKSIELSHGDEINCEQALITEKYEIINPATIADALLKMRPEGGYKEPQNLDVGETMVDYNMTYKITNDGTVMSVFEHEVLEEVNCYSYGGIQYIEREDAFGGGVYRYMPDMKPIVLNGKTYDFSKCYNATDGDIPNLTLTSEYWADEKYVPSREVSYMKNKDGKIEAAFVSGYVPVGDASPEKRHEKTSAWGFLYPTKKHYPFYVDKKAFDGRSKGKKIKGAGYKKYQAISENISETGFAYLIPYENDSYLFIDYQTAGKDKIKISEGCEAELLKKTENVSYEVKENVIEVDVNIDKSYGYIIFKLNKKYCKKFE